MSDDDEHESLVRKLVAEQHRRVPPYTGRRRPVRMEPPPPQIGAPDEEPGYANVVALAPLASTVPRGWLKVEFHAMLEPGRSVGSLTEWAEYLAQGAVHLGIQYIDGIVVREAT